MEKMNMSQEDGEVPLPGFRFHPTDEELVGFYLRRKVDKKPIRIDLIKQIDIYKHDPWDLPKSSNVGDNEWYFFCKRGRKYRNSLRPNRVTGSGFWKATGIDKPVYSVEGGGGRDSGHCIGLKKTLVYYRGSAGKGTKTDWMMHEFRLPTNDNTSVTTVNTKCIALEAEVWTLCRIFKRNISHKKYTPNDWRELSGKRHPTESSSKSCTTVESNFQEGYNISFANYNYTPRTDQNYNQKPVNPINKRNQQLHLDQLSSINPHTPSVALSSSFSIPDGDFFTYENWDELRSVVEFALDPSLL